jgi:hypothetical protein
MQLTLPQKMPLLSLRKVVSMQPKYSLLQEQRLPKEDREDRAVEEEAGKYHPHRPGSRNKRIQNNWNNLRN